MSNDGAIEEAYEDFWNTLVLLERGEPIELVEWSEKNGVGSGYVKIIREHLGTKKKANVTYASSLVGLQREIARKVLRDNGWKVPKASPVRGKGASPTGRRGDGGQTPVPSVSETEEQKKGKAKQAPGDDGGVQGKGPDQGAGDSVHKGTAERKPARGRGGSRSRKRANGKGSRGPAERADGGSEDAPPVENATPTPRESGPSVPEREREAPPGGDGNGDVGAVPRSPRAPKQSSPKAVQARKLSRNAARLNDIYLTFTKEQRDRYWKCLWWVDQKIGDIRGAKEEELKMYLIERIAQDTPETTTPISKKGIRALLAPEPRKSWKEKDQSQEQIFDDAR